MRYFIILFLIFLLLLSLIHHFERQELSGKEGQLEKRELSGKEDHFRDQEKNHDLPLKARDIILIDNEWHVYDDQEIILESGKLKKTLRVYGNLRGINITLSVFRNVKIFVYGNFSLEFGNFIFKNPKLKKINHSNESNHFHYYLNVVGELKFSNISISVLNPNLKNIIPRRFYFLGLPNQKNNSFISLVRFPQVSFDHFKSSNLSLNNVSINCDRCFSLITISLRNYCIREFCHLNPRNVVSYTYILTRLETKKYLDHSVGVIIGILLATLIALISLTFVILIFYSYLSDLQLLKLTNFL